MPLLHSLLTQVPLHFTIGHESHPVLIDIFKNLEGFIMIKFNIYEPSNHTLRETHIYIAYSDFQTFCPSTIKNTLNHDFMLNGNSFGLAVSQTIKLHVPMAKHSHSVIY